MSTNPFGVRNPEHVNAEYIAANFVDVFTDFPRLQEKGNTFVHGARGTGKSMLLRSLEPAVMLLREEGALLAQLPFLAVHVPLRRAEFGAPELTRYKGYASSALGEHLLVMHAMLRVVELLKSLAPEIEQRAASGYWLRFQSLYSDCGGKFSQNYPDEEQDSKTYFSWMGRICEREIVSVRQHYLRAPFGNDIAIYQGALAGFLDFLTPLATAIQEIPGLPRVPLFIMLDDADNLPRSMQKVLNSWVSSRSTPAICLKITTQLGYATYRTLDNRLIESPHDFAEVNLSAVYTSNYDNYNSRVRQIVTKRLKLAGLPEDVDAFFPGHKEQALRLKKIEGEIEAEHASRYAEDRSGARQGAARARDEKARYAVPRYMRELAGASRSGHTYSYSGFKSLVDVSSGVVRWFLEPASRMYDRMISQKAADIRSIPVGVQDDIIKEWSAEFLQDLEPRASLRDDEDDVESDRLPETEASLHASGSELQMHRLRNLIEGLGRLFRQKLLDEHASEQRAISIVVRDNPDNELQDILALGVRYGYLQRSDNAAKEALGGRRPRYILARRLGPHYRLDVSGYAAHLSVTSKHLSLALDDPAAFVKARLRSEKEQPPQLPLAFDVSTDDNQAPR